MITPAIDKEISFRYAAGEVLHFISSVEESCIHHLQKDHMLAYVYSGELTVHDGANEQSFEARHCVFIRKNHRIRLSIGKGNDETVKIVFLVFKRDFLIRFYREAYHPAQTYTGLNESFLEIDAGVEIKSLFYSLIPFIDSGAGPPEKTMELKLTEGIYALLNVNECTAAALFDFIDPWKIDILEFLNENFMYDLSLEEIALYTGRSLAAFKRDFQKISNLSPSRWIIDKRLEVAGHQMKHESKKVSDIYLDLGFKSLAHFSTAYKKKYGVAPTK